MVDGAGVELDRERDGALLRELVTVHAQSKPRPRAGFEVTTCANGVEGPAFEEHVRCLRHLRRLGQNLGECEVEVGVGIRELGRHGVRPEPGGHAAGRANRIQRRELGVAVEPVTGLRLEGRRPGAQHPAAVLPHPLGECLPARRTGGGNRCHDAAARSVQVLVRRSGGAQGELVDAIAGEASVRVAVHEPGDRTAATPVKLLDVAFDGPEVAHAPNRLDRVAVTEDVRVVEHVGRSELGATQRRLRSRRAGQLGEVADEQAARAAREAHSVVDGGIGASSPCASAAAIASA